MQRLGAIASVFLAAIFWSGPRAQASIILTDPSIEDEIPGVASFSTTGATMTGMEVTATFDSFSETLLWQSLGGTSGGVSGSDWSLSVTGDTFFSDWLFDNDTGEALQVLTLDGRGGLTVFDRSGDDDEFNPVPPPCGPANPCGTLGSAQGVDFSETPGFGLALATYSRIVALSGEEPVGDLWHVLNVDFREAQGNRLPDWSFVQDTDNDIRRPPEVPEPMTLALVGIGLAGLGFRRWTH